MASAALVQLKRSIKMAAPRLGSRAKCVASCLFYRLLFQRLARYLTLFFFVAIGMGGCARRLRRRRAALLRWRIVAHFLAAAAARGGGSARRAQRGVSERE